jgi:hypothetical protein
MFEANYKQKIVDGDCWMIRDPEYTKGKHAPSSKVKVIRYSRPCIVLGCRGNLATILPLTTKYNEKYILYPLQIEECRNSYGILSQVTTIEAENLSHFIGKIKVDVFEDIKRNLNLVFNNEIRRGVRSVPKRFNELDIARFYPFHVYKVRMTGYTFMVLRISRSEYLEIPVILQYKKNNSSEYKVDQINTFCGTVCMSEVRNLLPDKYKREVDDLGVEYRQNVRQLILNKLKKYTGMEMKDIPYHDRMEAYTHALHYLYRTSKYMSGYYKMMQCMENKKFQDILLNHPEKYFHLNKHEDDLMYLRCVRDIQLYVINHVNPLTCSISCLNIIGTFMNKKHNLLHDFLEPYKSAMNLNAVDGERIFDGRKIHEKYFVSNLRWIHNFLTSVEG